MDLKKGPLIQADETRVPVLQQESGRKVAAIMTVIVSAQQCGHNVRDYLADVLPRLATLKLTTGSQTPLLPNHWQPTAPAAPADPADPGIAVACPGTIAVPAHG